MKTRREIRDWLLENAVNGDGNLDMCYLDFRDFDGDVFISGMMVKGNLSQGGHEVQGNYHCINIKVKGIINTNEPTKLLKKITREELAKMGYEIEGSNFVPAESKNIDSPKLRGFQPKKADKPANKPKKMIRPKN